MTKIDNDILQGCECSDCGREIIDDVWQCKCREKARNLFLGFLLLVVFVATGIIYSILTH